MITIKAKSQTKLIAKFAPAEYQMTFVYSSKNCSLAHLDQNVMDFVYQKKKNLNVEFCVVFKIECTFYNRFKRFAVLGSVFYFMEIRILWDRQILFLCGKTVFVPHEIGHPYLAICLV